MKKFRVEFIIGIAIVVAMILVVVFGMREKDITEKKFHSDNLTAPTSSALSDEPTEAPTEKGKAKEEKNKINDNTEEKISKKNEASQAEAQPNTADEKKNVNESASDTEDKYSACTLSVQCDTVLKNTDKLSPQKLSLIPDDGIIFPETEVELFEGDSVFDVLKREMKNNNIHMEFSKTPAYDSVYIEGIANLYEFDCGELSGWTYSVNGDFPNYSCSEYELKDGDAVKWFYTCDMGADVKNAK